MSKGKMVKYGETVAVAVSGGKDSLSLLQVMSDLSVKHGSKLFAITIDEGVPGYREESIRLASDYSSKLGIKHVVLSFKDLYDIGLEDALEQREEKTTSCAICGTFRRRAIDLAALKVGADVVATAHNLDDFVQTFMINLFSGDIRRIRYSDPPSSSNPDFPVRRIKPFLEIYEKEIAFFAYLNDIPFQVASCPHMNEGIRTEVRNFLNSLEMKHPGLKQMAQKSALKIAEQLNGEPTSRKATRCESCGSPSSGKICSVCLMLDHFKSTAEVQTIHRSSVH
ncbi:MAG: TIGR00269 family protein [Nitrososphaerales archaeon]